GLTCRRIPRADGEYNWVAILAPKNLSNFLSHLTRWILVIAWQAACASVTWINSTIIIGIVQVNYPGYVTKNWHSTFMLYAVITVAVLINKYSGRSCPWLEAVAFLVHILGFSPF
ncbi:hypothetical protein BDU57DRAFT_570091, partial [Ampelomyces quisqualis]